MNQEKIDFLATKVMGWRKIITPSPSCRNNISFWSRDGKEKTETMAWNPWIDLNSAWKLVEKLDDKDMPAFFEEIGEVEDLFYLHNITAAWEISDAVYEIKKEEI